MNVSIQSVHAGNDRASKDWPYYAADSSASQFSNLSQINKSNIQDVKSIGRWMSPDQDILKSNPDIYTMVNEARPIAIDGDLYVSTSLSQVVKIDGVSMKTLWKYNPQSYLKDYPPNLGYVHRGVSFWKNKKNEKDQRIIYATGDGFLIALNAKTGKPISNFGKKGKVDLLKGLSKDGSDWPNRWQYGVTSPPMIVGDVVVVGSSIDDITKSKSNPPGDVRGFDVRTGRLIWTFHTIPHEGEPGFETWKNGSALRNGQANVWTIMSADLNRGLVYLPVSTPTNDFYGGDRPGDGLYGESIVCLDAETGKKIWHHQLVKHGLWDYDLPAAPNLSDVEINGQIREIVSVPTKQGYLYVFDRVTGDPIWPFLEKREGVDYPASSVETASPVQYVPSKPKAFSPQGSDGQDRDFLSPSAKAIAEQYILGPLFTPPSPEKKGTLILPGTVGGASWAGAAYNPKNNLIYVTSVVTPRVALLVKNPDGSDYDYSYDIKRAGITDLNGAPYTKPLFMPPFGQVTAIDLSTGETVWEKSMGRGPIDNPEIKEALKGTAWENKDLGWARRGHLLATTDLLFVAQSGQQSVVGVTPKFNALKLKITETSGEQNILVYDPNSGDIIHKIDLMNPDSSASSGNAQGGPMTFINKNGDQRIVVPVGGANMPAELVFLGLKKD